MTKLSDVVRYRSREMQDSMPTYYTESPEAISIMDANATEIERKRTEAADLQAQLFITTATWGLDEWERVLALSPRPNSSLEFRRNRILARLNGTAPATVAYLTDVVNAHVADSSARIVEYNSEYRFEAEVAVDKLLDIDVIYRSINEVKPAHLAFGVTAVIANVLRLVERAYSFDIPFPITNMFRTADVPGGIARIPINLSERAYSFEVLYPITNVLYPTGQGMKLADGVGITAYTTVYYTKYNRMNELAAGEADL